MANLNQIARTTRLGMTEGPAMPVNLTPEQLARTSAGMKTALGMAEPSYSEPAQLSAVAGERRSLDTEPRTTIYNTLGQRINALESVKKVVADHYARYDAGKRNLARSQTAALTQQSQLEESRKNEQQRQQETDLAEQARQQSVLTQESEDYKARKTSTATEEQRKNQAELEKRLAETKRREDEKLAAQKALQKDLQARAKADQDAQAAALKKQQDDFIAAQKANQKAYEEEEKKPKRAVWEQLIRTRQNNYMANIGYWDPNSLVVYNPGLAEKKYGPDRYTLEIPEFPEGLAPADDPNYKPPGGLPNLEDYLVAYDKSFGPVPPAYTKVFWQLKPEQRAGYLQAYQDENSSDSEIMSHNREDYLNSIGFTLDPNKPLIKEPMPDWKPTPATPATSTPDPRTQPQPAGSDQPGPLAGPRPPRSYALARDRYLLDNPDVARSGMDPWEHYLTFGQKQGLVWPGIQGPGGTPEPEPGIPGVPRVLQPDDPRFVRNPVEPQVVEPTHLSYEDSAKQYLADNPDVARSGMDPWEHYVSFGQKEGRKWLGSFPMGPGHSQFPVIPAKLSFTDPDRPVDPRLSGEQPVAPAAPLDFYSAGRRYLQDNQDVARAGVDPWWHYVNWGKGEGRVWPGQEEEQPSYGD